MVRDYSVRLGRTISGLLDNDKMTVSRVMEITDSNIVIGNNNVPVLEDAPCHLSFDTKDKSRDGNDDYIQQETGMTVFCSNDYDIQKGDAIVVKCGDYAVYRGRSGQPNKYKGRQSFKLEEIVKR